MPGRLSSSPAVPRRDPTVQAAPTSTASLCPSPYSVFFLGTSLFCPENSLFSFSLSLDSETLVAYGSCLMTYVQSWVLYTACPSSVLFSLSLSLSVLGCSLAVLQLVPYALHFFLLMVSALFLGPDLLNQ